MIPPTAVLELVSDDPRIAATARQVEETMEEIIAAALQRRRGTVPRASPTL